jgi:thiamine-phosphate pyrophosphorylase
MTIRSKGPGLRGLYGITDSRLMPDAKSLRQSVSAALSGGLRIVQYRDKQSDRTGKTRNAEILRRLCDQFDALLIINDDVELMLEVGADGVHLGRDDASIRSVRERIGDRGIIGASCYDQLSRAVSSADAGCDYVAFGRFFPSLTKPDAVRAKPELLAQARQQLSLPLCAIGGITPDNAGQLVDQGADMIAVIQGLFAAPDIERTARQFSVLFNQ